MPLTCVRESCTWVRDMNVSRSDVEGHAGSDKGARVTGAGRMRGRIGLWTSVPALMVTAIAAACGGRTPILETLEDDDCQRTAIVGQPAAAAADLDSDSLRQVVAESLAVDWRLPAESVEVVQLNAWCAAVGPAVVGGWGEGEVDLGIDPEGSGQPDPVTADDTGSGEVPEPVRPVADTLWLVSWNVRVDGGDLRGLVSDFREGRLTSGHRPEHFVLLLQEVYRGGDLVPAYDPSRPGASGIRLAPEEVRADIVALAEELDLWLFYAPSMRNGEDEDRGNAILSTLPLDNPAAMALPVARQRRVAVSADVSGRTRDGGDWQLQVTSVHLESQPSGWTSDEAQRLAQARALVSMLPDAEVAIAAGDFNTKTRSQDEALVGTMLRAYPDTPPFPSGPTYRRAYGFYREYLDYIFYRTPGPASGRYDRGKSMYGSDHYPLVGWVAW